MEPSQWGPSGWTMLHAASLEADRLEEPFESFVESYVSHLPCETCRVHAKDYVRNNPVQKPYFQWTVSFHNAVNERLGKPIVDLKDAYQVWASKECSFSCRGSGSSTADVETGTISDQGPEESKNSWNTEDRSVKVRNFWVSHVWAPSAVCLIAGLVIYWFLIQWINHS